MASTAGSGLGVGTLAAGAAVVGVLGVVIYQMVFAPEPEAPVGEGEPGVSQPVDQPAPEAGQEIAALPGGGEEPAPSEVPEAPVAPSIDIVRVDAAGGALIAGQAAANADLRLLLDGEEIHLASSDATGEFVAMFDIPPSERPRILSLEMILQDGSVLVSEQSVIISPTLRVVDPSEGVEVAEAEAETEQAGPETPESSGIGDLALAETEETAPAGGTAPPVPAAPDLPEAAPGDGSSVGAALTPATSPELASPSGAGTPTGEIEQAVPAEEQVIQSPGSATTQDGTAPELLAAAPEVAQPAANEAGTPQPGAPNEGQQVAEASAPQEPPAPEPGSLEAVDGTDPPAEPQAVTQTPTVLLADREGIRVIQSGEGPQAQTQVSLDTIAYDTEGEVVLAGRGSAEADVRFYLDNQPVQIARIDLSGAWSTELPQVDPGTYTLRLDELGPEGAVQSRIETPFLREEPETVAEITSRTGENVITVQWGNTLWGIAQRHLGEGVMYVQIYEANRDQIRNPDLIYPGQIFTIPEAPADPEQ